MTKKLSQIAFVMAGCFLLMSYTVIEDLRDHLAGLEDGDELNLEYSFEGCYGPYHHGRIDFKYMSDTIYFTETSYDHAGKKGLTQSGKYLQSKLLDLLKQSEKSKTREILGNTITYRISVNDRESLRGADRIDQHHFIEIFKPFSSVFSKGVNPAIPGLNTGGFVH